MKLTFSLKRSIFYIALILYVALTGLGVLFNDLLTDLIAGEINELPSQTEDLLT